MLFYLKSWKVFLSPWQWEKWYWKLISFPHKLKTKNVQDLAKFLQYSWRLVAFLSPIKCRLLLRQIYFLLLSVIYGRVPIRVVNWVFNPLKPLKVQGQSFWGIFEDPQKSSIIWKKFQGFSRFLKKWAILHTWGLKFWGFLRSRQGCRNWLCWLCYSTTNFCQFSIGVPLLAPPIFW